MKSFERIILHRILQETRDKLDPLQFAYRYDRGVDDATLSLLHDVNMHLDTNNDSYARILFIDFSSAFNTIQPHILARKLINMGVFSELILWIMSFLTHRTQNVCFEGALSRTRTICTGAPQGTVLSPVLFILYTNDCRSLSDQCNLYKFSDDSALVDKSASHTAYLLEVERLIKWCKENFLDLNVKKTKEMVFESGKNVSVPELCIDGECVERVNEYKYLGTVIDSQLNFKTNTDYINKKCRQRMHCLYKLRSLGVNTSLLRVFYKSFIESILTFSIICTYGTLCVKSKRTLERVVNTCSKIICERQKGINELYEQKVITKAVKITQDQSHVLCHLFELLPSGRRYRTMKCKVKTQKTFVPFSIQALNKINSMNTKT